VPLAGYATLEGTARYRQRFAGRAADGHFRCAGDWWLSSLGAGTYLGEPDAATDEQYTRALTRALELGVNVLDTAINYRFQRSERSLAAALANLVGSGTMQRDEMVVSTKAGFLTFDGGYPPDPNAYFLETYIRPGIVRPEEVVGGMHCLAPRFLEDQLECSRRNLGLDTIDIFYLHNPETQLQILPREEFLSRLRAAFAALERAVVAGRIRCYGAATWDGFRRPPGARDYLSLEELEKLAVEVAGPGHHCKVIQLPYNLAMPEALLFPNQRVAGEEVSLLEAARRLGVTVFASASLLQGQVAQDLPGELRQRLGVSLRTDAQRALQFVRSTPGVGAALVGMKRLQHVEENLALVAQPLLTEQQFRELLK
jgi:aryl-alcohol dehydrogenase-like predicted oxidoreductase